MPFVAAVCTQCNAPLKVDSEQKAAICEHCGSAFVVEDAINTYNNQYFNTTNIKDSVVYINNEGGDHESDLVFKAYSLLGVDRDAPFDKQIRELLDFGGVVRMKKDNDEARMLFKEALRSNNKHELWAGLYMIHFYCAVVDSWDVTRYDAITTGGSAGFNKIPIYKDKTREDRYVWNLTEYLIDVDTGKVIRTELIAKNAFWRGHAIGSFNGNEAKDCLQKAIECAPSDRAKEYRHVYDSRFDMTMSGNIELIESYTIGKAGETRKEKQEAAEHTKLLENRRSVALERLRLGLCPLCGGKIRKEGLLLANGKEGHCAKCDYYVASNLKSLKTDESYRWKRLPNDEKLMSHAFKE
ncbi:MAG: hypothetical protein LBK04_03440 [Clostridiales Family XIII bacterium]|jgi:predicted RNA-binding Zn-ribbon protein involved in translation (DUF1610 family)|nr:hypothetical protein [Clostridiales Family XIII bacterium]